MAVKESVAQEAQEDTAREGCAGCGDAERALLDPVPNAARGYRGPTYCLCCNPRFSGFGPDQDALAVLCRVGG